jgi:aminopeptidase N
VFLAMNDSDLFNRWDASQQYGVDQILKMVKDIQSGREPVIPEGYFNIWKSYLTDKTLEKSFIARAITLPQENYLADKMDVVDVDALHTARHLVKKAFAERFGKELKEVYAENDVKAVYEPSAAEAGRRALKNMALSFLGDLETADSYAMIEHQFDTADNMSDKLAAMNIASNSKCPHRESIMESFYGQYSHDRGVVNKWIFARACADRIGGLGLPRFVADIPGSTRKMPIELL